MENFIAYNPTMLHFGKNVTDKLGETVSQYGKTALLIYGKGSVVTNGYYQNIKYHLEKANIKVVEYSGIRPNPVIDDVDKASELCRKENVDLIVALGGGSVIDSAKAVSVCAPENLKVWDVVKGKSKPTKSLPLIAVLTLAATGTEMNPFAVVQNPETSEKIGFGGPLMYPKHSFLDPQFTYSVPKNYTAYGIADLIAHSLENFFGFGHSPLSDRFVAAIVMEAMHYGPLLLSDLTNYDYRANILWQSTCALNGTTLHGRAGGDWGVHDLGHSLSVLFDTPHGATLSIAYIAWFKWLKTKDNMRLSELSKLLYNTGNTDVLIEKFESFFKSIECPVRLAEVGIEIDKKQMIFDTFTKNNVTGTMYKMNEADRMFLLENMYSL